MCHVRINYYDDSEADEDDDDERTTLFSSVSLSSDSSDSFRRNRVSYEVNGPVMGECEMGLAPLQGKEKNSFVVKKRSSDPYDDFRNSMVEEMIIEKQIFGASDLEDLLRTFLSLNSYHHHRVIVQVCTEIWDALFSTLS